MNKKLDRYAQALVLTTSDVLWMQALRARTVDGSLKATVPLVLRSVELLTAVEGADSTSDSMANRLQMLQVSERSLFMHSACVVTLLSSIWHLNCC